MIKIHIKTVSSNLLFLTEIEPLFHILDHGVYSTPLAWLEHLKKEYVLEPNLQYYRNYITVETVIGLCMVENSPNSRQVWNSLTHQEVSLAEIRQFILANGHTSLIRFLESKAPRFLRYIHLLDQIEA